MRLTQAGKNEEGVMLGGIFLSGVFLVFVVAVFYLLKGLHFLARPALHLIALSRRPAAGSANSLEALSVGYVAKLFAS
jgi:hypothetical protein